MVVCFQVTRVRSYWRNWISAIADTRIRPWDDRPPPGQPKGSFMKSMAIAFLGRLNERPVEKTIPR
ncbi:MAG: hypothetical protein WCD18_12980 [Thermosynechococcaceae cyanobacterium]